MGQDAHRAGGGGAPGALLDERADRGAHVAGIVRSSEQIAPPHADEPGPGAHEAPAEQARKLVEIEVGERHGVPELAGRVREAAVAHGARVEGRGRHAARSSRCGAASMAAATRWALATPSS